MINELTSQIKNIIKITFGKEIGIELDFPPDVKLGDFTINCFSLTKELKKNPNEIAEKLTKALVEIKDLEKIEVAGPYVNITLRNDILFRTLAKQKLVKEGSGKKIMVEYLQPNTNKPLHLGHVRNGCLGIAVSNILKINGNEVIKANLINDRGIHICKSILAWQKWSNGETPQSSSMKGDHFVGKYYVKFSQEAAKNPELEKEAQELLKRWEDNDPEIRKIWSMMNGWVYEGFDATNENFGFAFDKLYYESETYKLGKEIVKEGLAKGIFHEDEKGFIVFDLPKDEFGLDKDGKSKKVTLQRPDGTSLYLTQDLGTARMKFDEFDLSQAIYVVGSEQDYHFKCLFAILKALGFSWAKNCYHLSYGMVYLPEGKMKSREGKVVDADDLLEEVIDLAKVEMEKRNVENVDQNGFDERAKIVALAAIKFYLLKTGPRNDIYFNPKESISFDGSTGPYCQYAYARASKIIEKSKKSASFDIDFSVLGNNEERLIGQKLFNLKQQIGLGENELNPARVANGVYDVAVAFNQFYQKHKVINAGNEDLVIARLALVEMVRKALKEGLNILGIDVLIDM